MFCAVIKYPFVAKHRIQADHVTMLLTDHAQAFEVDVLLELDDLVRVELLLGVDNEKLTVVLCVEAGVGRAEDLPIKRRLTSTQNAIEICAEERATRARRIIARTGRELFKQPDHRRSQGVTGPCPTKFLETYSHFALSEAVSQPKQCYWPKNQFAPQFLGWLRYWIRHVLSLYQEVEHFLAKRWSAGGP